MTQATMSRLVIGMADVAILAGVQRPVVSMWRSRSAGTDRAFPAPVTSDEGPARFDAVEVARWLAETGHGNNPSAVDDVAAFATIDGASPRDDPAVFAAVMAMLCLKVVAGAQLGELDGDELLDLAARHDPQDQLMYAELESIGPRLAALATYADLLADAAFSPQAAFETLMANRFRSDLTAHTAAAISKSALSLAAKVAVGLADRDAIPAVYVDPTPGSSDLILAVVHEHGNRGPLEVMTVAGEDSTARLVRRRLRVHDIYQDDLAVDDGGAFDVTRPVTHIAQFPTPGAPTMSDVEVLTAIENVVVQMDDSQRGIVIAPASALSDGFADSAADAVRADILRAGHVRAIVRLPKGLVPARSRQALAMWVLGAAHRDVETADRFTMIADLANASLTPDVVDSLVTDLIASTGTRQLVRAHTFRFVHPVPTRTLLAATRSLVEVAPAQINARDDAAARLLRIEQVTGALGELDSPPRIPSPIRADPVRSGPMSTIGVTLASRQLRMIRGNRLDESDIGTGDGVTVIGVPELIGQSPGRTRTVDRFVLAGRYGAARLTEPGDVVFCTSPRPAALVDRAGSSVVAYPARVLRIDARNPVGVLADVVAADINAAPPGAREWRLWPVRRIADEDRGRAIEAFAELRRAREDAERRRDRIAKLTELITDGLADGTLTLQTPDKPTKGR